MRRRWRWISGIVAFGLFCAFALMTIFAHDPSWDWVEAHGKAKKVVSGDPSEDLAVSRVARKGSQIETRKYAFGTVPDALWTEVQRRNAYSLGRRFGPQFESEFWIGSGSGEWLHITKISESKSSWLAHQWMAFKFRFFAPESR